MSPPFQTVALSQCPVGIVPIHWAVTRGEVEGLLAELRRLGYEGLQLGDTFPHGTELASLLSRHGLRLAEVYAALPCTPDGPTEDALDIAQRRLDALDGAGGDVLVPAIDGTPDRDRWTGRAAGPEVPRLTDSGWAKLGDLVNHLSEETRSRGQRLAFHPHSGTYVETPAEVERLLEVTASSGAGICVDTGHVLVGGGDPVATIELVGDRLTHIHLKDVDPAVRAELRTGEIPSLTDAIAQRVFCPLGSGMLDLAGVLAALGAGGYRGWLMVEQDTSWEPPPEASAISRRVLAYALRAVRSST